MKSSIFIPKKIKVGFNPRTDTYTGKLGYIIYNDGKVWRKEKSWEDWRYSFLDEAEIETKRKEAYDRAIESSTRAHASYVQSYSGSTNNYYKQYADMSLQEYLDKQVGPYDTYKTYLGKVSPDPTIVPMEMDNTPLEGFVLNKKVGGYDTGWNHRQTYCRVYDPRGFEFEITIPNLLYILENTSSIKGKGLEGKFIYGWDGKELILIPEDSPDYKEMVEFTDIQSMQVNKKDLVVAGVYMHKNGTKVTFMGEGYEYDSYGKPSESKKLWFFIKEGSYREFDIVEIKNIKKFTGELNPNFVTLMDKIETNQNYKPKKDYVFSYIEYSLEQLKAALYYNYNSNSWGYGRTKRVNAFIQEKKKYVSCTVECYNNENYTFIKGRTELTYNTLQQLLNNHIILKELRDGEDYKTK